MSWIYLILVGLYFVLHQVRTPSAHLEHIFFYKTLLTHLSTLTVFCITLISNGHYLEGYKAVKFFDIWSVACAFLSRKTSTFRNFPNTSIQNKHYLGWNYSFCIDCHRRNVKESLSYDCYRLITKQEKMTMENAVREVLLDQIPSVPGHATRVFACVWRSIKWRSTQILHVLLETWLLRN